MKKRVEERKEWEAEYMKNIDELMYWKKKSIEQKDQEVEYLRNNVQVVSGGKQRSGYLDDE